MCALSATLVCVLSYPPVSFVCTEGEGEVGCYFLKVPQRDVTILVRVVVFHDGLQGATEKRRENTFFNLSRSSWLSSALACQLEKEVKEAFFLLQSHRVLTSTICLTCLDMVSGSCLGVTPEPHSATTGGLT